MNKQYLCSVRKNLIINFNELLIMEKTIYIRAYVEDSTDGMVLCTVPDVYTSKDSIIKECEDDEMPYMDYEDDVIFDGEEYQQGDLPDYYNEGRECIGYILIIPQTIEI